MENWMRTEYQKLKDDEKITDLIENVKQKNEVKSEVQKPTQWSVKSNTSHWEESY
tara:strand:- start:3438 stop:3602 length:165 start_codon:yes stop_codon:yes gene_type:complete